MKTPVDAEKTPALIIRCTWGRCLAGMFLLAVILTTGRVAVACDADSVLRLMEQKVQSHLTIRMKYTKDSHSLLFGDRPTEEGILWLGPPQRYRIETGAQVYVRGIDTLWTYNATSKQVTVRTGNLDSLEFGPAGFFGSLRTDFLPVDCSLDKSGKTPQWRVRLAAKTEVAAIQRLTLWIDTKTHLPNATEYVDYNEETSLLRFFDYRSDQAKDRQEFSFVAPDDAEVIILPAKKTARQHDIQP